MKGRLKTLFLTLLLISCAKIPQKITYQSDKNWIALKEATGVDKGLFPFSHPKTISPEAIDKILGKVFYQENVVVSLAWGRQKPVFSDSQKALLVSQLPIAFSKASPTQVVVFSVRGEKNTHEVTEGYFYALRDELHLVFNNVRKPDFLGDPKPYQPSQNRWRLVAQEGQRFLSSQLIIPLGGEGT